MIDWQEVRNRLDASQQALDEALTPNPERAEAIFRQRAAQLATRRVQFGTADNASRVLVFAIGSEKYAIEFDDLVELLPFANCTAVPGAPPELLGVMNIHGEIQSVVDLRRLLDLPDGKASVRGYVLVIRRDEQEVGVRVDHVEKVQPIIAAELAVLREGMTDLPAHYLKGLTPDKVIVLSTEALFEHPVFKAKGDQ